MKKKMFFIIVSVLAMIGATVYMGITLQKNSQKTFTKSGYILDSNLNSANNKEEDKDKDKNTGATKYYFGKDTAYKSSIDSSVEFKDTNGKTVKVSEASFIHYDDDSVGLLKKGVVLNLEDIKSTIPIYYNLYEGTILQYANGNYIVDNLGKELKFAQFIVRVDDNKYLLVSDDLKVQLDENTSTTIKSNYVEISVVEEGIIRIENQDATYNTVSKDAYIDLGNDMTLNLDNGYFFIGEEPIVNLNSMVIDSDDNVDITPIDEIKEQIEKEKEEAEGTDNTIVGGGGGGGGSAGDALGGFVGTETEVVENELTLPTATLTDVQVSANSFQGSISINDPDSLITGTAYTYIMDNSTSRVVFEKETDQGVYSIDVFSENLTPETNYMIVTTIQYEKNDIEYTMDVIQSLFVTSSIGITIEKEYYGVNELSFIVKIDDYSRVKSADVRLKTSNGEVIDSQPITDVSAKVPGGLSVLFTGLSSNTKYTVEVFNILYQDTVVAEEYNLAISAKTLKERPRLGTLSYSIDKRNNVFTLKLNNISDPDSGIDRYVYEIYDARTYASGAEPIVTYDKSTLGSVDVHIEDGLIERGIPYLYKVTALFYDNEKYIEYVAGPSNPFRMDGVEAPSVSWETDEANGGIAHDAIHGKILISDPRGTIDYTKNITVVFTNSIGTTTTRIFTSGNSILPINELNLRKNETYTFSVYATVNLMDNNGSVDSYHIGSVTVNTLATNPFDVFFYVQPNVTTDAFSVQCKLLNVTGADNTYEATTMNELTFLLYEGPNTSGTLIKRLRKVDKNVHDIDKNKYDYNSSLKDSYYDSTFTINPAFFNMNNTDFSSEYYTIQVAEAKDYTDFQNDIGIIPDNSSVTVQVHGFVEDPDPEAKEWFSTSLIRNKDAGDYGKYDENLAEETIVGIRVKANYDNTRKYGKYINYTVWDYCNPAQPIELTQHAKSVEFKADGTIDDVYYWFDYGTASDVDDSQDTVLRRGHVYVFSFVAGLDLDHDDTPETRYPASEDKLLKSKQITISKQMPTILMYPASSTSNSMKVKYLYEDVDYTLRGNHLTGMSYDYADGINKTTHSSSVKSIERTPDGVYKEVTFNNILSNYYFAVAAEMNNIKGRADTIVYYIDQLFQSEYTLPTIEYSLTTDVNRVIISIDNYSGLTDAINRIPALKITFTAPGRDPIVKDFVKINGDHAVVDMYDISDFLGQTVTVDVEAYYDTNLIGWEQDSEYYALKSITDIYGDGVYYTLSANDYPSATPIARGSIFSKALVDENYVLSLKNSSFTYTISATPQQGGIKANGVYLNLNKLATKDFVPSVGNTFYFNQLIPGIKIRDANGEPKISPGIKTASFEALIFGFGEKTIKDNKVYVQISKTDANASFLEPFGSAREFSIEEVNSGAVELTGLSPKQDYALEFFAYIDDGTDTDTYVYSKLYDLDANNNTSIYVFKTLSSVGITNIAIKYLPSSYDNKSLILTYDLDRIMGYDKIEYKLYKNTYNSDTASYEYVETSIVLDADTGFKNNMTKIINCNPGSGFSFGSVYKLTITPYVEDSPGVWVALDETIGEHIFVLSSLKKPTVGVSASINVDPTYTPEALTFYVLFYDSDRVVKDDNYTITVEELDSTGNVIRDVTPSNYAGQSFPIEGSRTPFVVDNLIVNTNYRFNVNYKLDIRNTGNAIDKTFSYVSKALDANSVSSGDVSAVANATNKNKIDLNFINSYRLDTVDRIRYSIYNSFDGTSFDNEMAFSLKTKNVGGNVIYYITLPDILSSQGLYVVQYQLISNNSVVDEQTIDYNFI